MPGGNTHFNSDWLSFKNYIDVLISFWYKKKDTFSAFCTLCNVSLQTKMENPCLVTQRSKKWKANSNCWWQVWKLGAYIIYNDCIIWYEFNLALYVILQNFSKISYLIPEAVGPSFNTLNIEDVKQSSSVFIIHYDEKFIILSRRWWNTIITIAIPWKWWSKCW